MSTSTRASEERHHLLDDCPRTQVGRIQVRTASGQKVEDYPPHAEASYIRSDLLENYGPGEYTLVGMSATTGKQMAGFKRFPVMLPIASRNDLGGGYSIMTASPISGSDPVSSAALRAEAARSAQAASAIQAAEAEVEKLRIQVAADKEKARLQADLEARKLADKRRDEDDRRLEEQRAKLEAERAKLLAKVEAAQSSGQVQMMQMMEKMAERDREARLAIERERREFDREQLRLREQADKERREREAELEKARQRMMEERREAERRERERDEARRREQEERDRRLREEREREREERFRMNLEMRDREFEAKMEAERERTRMQIERLNDQNVPSSLMETYYSRLIDQQMPQRGWREDLEELGPMMMDLVGKLPDIFRRNPAPQVPQLPNLADPTDFAAYASQDDDDEIMSTSAYDDDDDEIIST